MSWKLKIGCHSGTIVSRDSHVVTAKYDDSGPLESLEDCIECAKAWDQNYRSMSSQLWLATAISPDGEQFQRVVPTSYPVR